jgi:Tol biopolymer transport system component
MKKKNYILNFLVFILMTVFFSTKIRAQYDLYVFDVKTGATKRITSLPNSGEWNATWSNNGKKIAHDIAGPNVQSIYITDVETGVSTPLAGAETGNDAAWSPNGEKIAFDAWEDYYNIGWWTQNIYTVPAAGGTKSLLRFNAHHATWNPQGNRIAFDDSYGNIWTKDINTGYEYFVTWLGDRPSWSPNGQYIAFDGVWWAGGGVWVVKVDSFGIPQSWPVQVTTSGYGPTWSNNSKEIVFIDWPNGDPDLYSVPVTGGVPTRVCGRVGGFDKGDYDPAYSNNGQFIAWSSYTDASFTNKVEKPRTELNEKNSFVLEQNSPNPFASETKINFRIVETLHVVMNVYNIAGQRVKTLANADYKPGYYSVSWNGKDENNKMLSSGLYLCQLQSENNVQVKKMNLMR